MEAINGNIGMYSYIFCIGMLRFQMSGQNWQVNPLNPQVHAAPEVGFTWVLTLLVACSTWYRRYLKREIVSSLQRFKQTTRISGFQVRPPRPDRGDRDREDREREREAEIQVW